MGVNVVPAQHLARLRLHPAHLHPSWVDLLEGFEIGIIAQHAIAQAALSQLFQGEDVSRKNQCRCTPR